MISAVRLAPYGHQPFFDTLSPSTRAALLMTAVVLVIVFYQVLARWIRHRRGAYARRRQGIIEARTIPNCRLRLEEAQSALRFSAKVQAPAEVAAAVCALADAWRGVEETMITRLRNLESPCPAPARAASRVFPREYYIPAAVAYTAYTSDYDTTDDDTTDYDTPAYDWYPQHNVDGTPMIQGMMIDVHGDGYGTPCSFDSFE